ncbi:PTS sugar transporter subunit IIA [Xylocopilactobacillus apicola]|uniref:PTS sugar transporter subunit IIA n=1 Tax=Xylocopilactobacillus apicola TaxID=2932184 RepID=A0AAU9CZ70_9LACO|nr:PTS sugar transporter subunit IIA [Xylocopilactobacillus apicola]BDR59294.1 PTS sugar transporter subunit IIA [Xylocopilactobacillus apicola]
MVLISKDLIFKDKTFNDREEALNFSAQKLLDNGLVKKTYAQAILEREKIFPTGLPTGNIKVAIPHADAEHVNESALAITTLKKPVGFQNMGDPDSTLDVSIIIMMAIAEPKKQVAMLQQLMKIVQDQDYLQKILDCQSTDELYDDLQKKFCEM